MIGEEIKKKLIDIVSDMKIDPYEGITRVRLFSNLFGEFPSLYNIIKCDDGYSISLLDNDEPLLPRKSQIIDFIPTIDNIVKEFDGIKFQMHPSELYIVGDRIVMKAFLEKNGKYYSLHEISIATNIEDVENIKNRIVSSFVIKDILNDENSYKIAYRGQYSIDTTVCKFNDWKSDIKGNYNDDVPYEKMNEIIRSDGAGLMMFYGIPGTGKTSIVKSLINDNRDTHFIFVDTSVCESISDGLFLEFLQDNKNSVIVFEDCEKLLSNRDEMQNESLGTILNLTDGIIAESMKIKFICTFNCNIEKVDPALLRKGRLSLKYEFKELSLEKTKAIYPEAEKPMTLADAHNAYIKNDFSEKKSNKIGFI